jgi:[protein-PII] uridylyltransferase
VLAAGGTGADDGVIDVSIKQRRAQRAADDSLVGAALCRVWSGDVDAWLAGLFKATTESEGTGSAGLALVAVGGYGRGEMSLHSDIDVILVHEGRPTGEVAKVADGVWYPIWDAGMKLGHAVRTVNEALALAADDLDTATSLLDARHLAGDQALADKLKHKVELLWRKRSRRFLSRMDERVSKRHSEAGEVAYLLEPDLKNGRGGLRDVHCLRWAQATRSILWGNDHHRIDAAYSLLLAVRVELHRRIGRPTDTLLLQEQDAVAAALGYARADDLMQDLAQAARTVAWTSDDAWARIESSLAGPLSRIRRERPIGPGLVLREGEVHITGDSSLVDDPALPLRAAAAAATHGTRLDRASLAALAEVDPHLPRPWPVEVREGLVELLLAGPPAVPVLEALDQVGIWERYVPEWSSVRSKPQRNAYHRFTVDRHLWEAAAQTARLAGQVSRPDLLVVGALFHDIGKGAPGDHTDNGVELLRSLGPRMGFDEDDVALLVAMCRHHLLLPDVATRRDLDDEVVISTVATAVGSTRLLSLLAALTEGDSLATGPAAWSTWKAELVRSLVARVSHVLEGGELAGLAEHGRDTEPIPTAEQRQLLAAGKQVVYADGDRLTVVCPDRHGLFNRVTGVLALHGLRVLDAAAVTENATALEVFRVESAVGPTFSWQPVLDDIERVLAGRLALPARLAERARRYPHRQVHGAHDVEAEVRFDQSADDARATVVEVHAPDSVGALYRITRAMADLDLEIVSAKVQTLGPLVVDSFYVQDATGQKLVDESTRAELERAILHELAS